MKTSATGILSLFLLSVLCASTAGAQPPAADPQDQTPPQGRAQPNIRQPPPPLPKVPDIRQPGETGYWIGITAWFPTQEPIMDKGRAATFTTASRTQLQGKPKVAQGAEIGIAAGAHNTIHLTYFEDRAAGGFTNATDIQLWNQTYTAGNFVSTDYRLQQAKVSFEYLTWPYPVEKSKFRLRTLWGLQYTAIRTGFDLPLLPLVDSSGNPILDSAGNAVDYTTKGSHWFMTPSIGIGLTQYVSRHLRLEANASGFTIPRHTTTWDADASANFRAGHFELRVGVKAFHFKTSTQAEFFMHGTQSSGFVGLRWYSD